MTDERNSVPDQGRTPLASNESPGAPPRARVAHALSRKHLQQELSAVSDRYRKLLLLAASAVALLLLAAAGAAAIALVRGAESATPVLTLIFVGLATVVLLPVLGRALRRVADPAWVARRVEQEFPALDARLLAAVEQQSKPTASLGYLQQTVIDQSLAHARVYPWAAVVPTKQMRAVGVANVVTAAAAVTVATVLAADLLGRRSGTAGSPGRNVAAATPAEGFDVKVEPGDASVERGTSLIVLARFGRSLPPEAVLLIAGDDKQRPETPMSKSMDDPVFAARVPSVERKLTYAVRYGGRQTPWYTVDTFDHPELRQLDAKLTYPGYTGAKEKVVEDTRSVTAVEGTKATLTFRLTKPVTTATLVPEVRRGTTNPAAEATTQPTAVALVPDPAEPGVYTAQVDMRQSARYRLDLVDDAGRGSKRPAEVALNVTPNRPPELKLDFPAKDVDVSPIEEMTVRAKVSDDFGVRRVGMSYSMAGKPPQDVVLAEGVGAKEKKDVAHTVALEKLAAEPDQLLSYYMWAEDVAPDGTVRRTSGDMFFAEVRPFEEIFRQGEQPPEGEQSQQQQQQAGQNAQAAEEAAENQKQIIAATWKLVRRELGAVPTPAFASDAKLLAESQAEVRQKAEAMEEKLTDERSKAFLKNVLKHMDAAAAELTKAAEAPSTDRSGIDRLPAALSAEQAAYQELLRLRAREHEVVRGNRQQQRGQQSQSSASSRRQQQLDQLKLTEEQNRYEQQRSAAQQQQQNQAEQQQRETRQVLSRLRELAQRQEDLNKQMKEAQSALDEAKDEAKKEEARRQLARLRDQQKEMLRDTDELRDRTEQPGNQEQMADARQQLDQTREDVRKASEALESGKTQEAAAAGARAGEQLEKLKEDFRRKAAGQFGEAVERMRQDARSLDEKQQELSQQLAEPDRAGNPQDGGPGQPGQGQPGQGQTPRAGRQPTAAGEQPQPGERPQPGEQPGAGESAQAGNQRAGEQPQAGPRPQRPNLRTNNGDGTGRQQVARDLEQQKERLEQLLERMRQTVEEAEATEPLLSKQLYDAVRDTRQQRTDEALDAAKQMVDRGVVDEARRAEAEAGKGIARLRKGVEQAATGVLGDETEALRRARGELDALNQELANEMARNGVAQRPGQRENDPSRGGQAAGNDRRDPSTRPAGNGEGQVARGGPRDGAQTRPAGEGQVARGGQRDEAQTRPAGQARGEERPGAEGERQAQASARPSRSPNGQQPGENPGEQAGRQPGQGRAGQNGQGQQPGQGQAQGEGPGQAQGQAQGEGQGRGQGQGQAQGEGQGRGQGREEAQGEGQGRGEGRGQGQTQGQGQGGDQPGQARQPGGQQRPGGLRGGTATAGGNQTGGGGGPGGNEERAGPMTGDNFRQWSDRLRDVEEMVGDPKLRAEAARIRDRAKAIRNEADRHSKEPNWDMVNTQIGQPLAELRAAVAEELRRRDPEAGLVPVDRDPVPPGYAEQVRRYYERLGSGK